jgi:hypothetical protein
LKEVRKDLDDFVRHDTAPGGITTEQYLLLCQQLGQTPDPSKMPKSINQFPQIVQTAMRIYNKLPDLHTSLGMEGSVYSGKSYASFLDTCKIYYIHDDYDRMIVMHVCEHLERGRLGKEHAALNKARNKNK